MNLKFKSYHPKQAKQRQKKRSITRSALAPTSTTSVGSLPPLSSVAGHRCSHIDEKFIPVTITNRDENPYFDFPTTEEFLDYCLPISENPVTDSTIDPQHTSRDLSCHGYRYKDDELRQRLPAAIAIMPLTSELNIEREAYNINTSEEGSNTEISSAEYTWSQDTKTTPSTVSSISTPLATSTYCQKQFCRNQDAFIHSQDNMQDTSPQIADLDVSDAISHAALSGGNSAASESQEPSSSAPSDRQVSLDGMNLRAVAAAAASILPSITSEPSITEPGLFKKTLAPVEIPSSTKRLVSEHDGSIDSQRSGSEAYHSPKRRKLTSNTSEEIISSIRNAAESILRALDTLSPVQSHDLIADVSVQSIHDTIEVAVDEIGDDWSDTLSSTRSSPSESDSEAELGNSQSQKSIQRRRWTKGEEDFLRRLKRSQQSNGTPSDYYIAKKLKRTENGVKQHWDIMQQKDKRKR
ncbi:hypothetical protein FOCG_16337 [Fusarium oxysporum f. sp. radicis-lycopersici 26381]|nr:hypothetical protein FOCG_16337 [Fusarium oxysporum f. sp. radicis-lycopersici 26381]